MSKGNFEFFIFKVGSSKISTHKFSNTFKSTLLHSKFGLAACLLILVAAAQTAAAPLTTGADFLLMTTGARPDGMGQAFSAVADDINTLSFNPAGLGNIRLPEVGYSHEDFVAGIGYDFAGAALPAGSLGVLGLGYIGMGTAPFNSTANPQAPTAFAQDRALIGAWGKSFYDLHVGFAVKYITIQMDTLQGNALAFDLGVRYRPLPGVILAASGMNLGTGIQLTSVEPLPVVLNTGLAWTPLEETGDSLTFALNGAFDLVTQVQQYGLGAEYWYRNTLALRAGYLLDSRSTEFSVDGASAGAGVRVGPVQLDYAYQPFDILGVIHRFSGILRWDGPWLPGGEPNAPKSLRAQTQPGAVDIQWDRAAGPVAGYELRLQPLDGNVAVTVQTGDTGSYPFKNYLPDTLYRITAYSIGNGGGHSYPSPPAYVLTQSAPGSPAAVTGVSRARGLEGGVDAVGLRLSWAVPAEGAEGYLLYRRSPEGRVERVTQEPKRGNALWIVDPSGYEGWEWIVTALGPGGQTEKRVGSYLWYPTPADTEKLGRPPALRLFASPEPGHRVFLDWNPRFKNNGYSLFVSRKADGVYEYFKDVSLNQATLLIKGSQKGEKLYFLIAARGEGDAIVDRSNGAQAEPGL